MSAPKANTSTLRLISKDNIIIAPKQYAGRKDISMIVIDTPKLCYVNESAFKEMDNLFSIQINAKGIVLCSDSLANNQSLQTVSIKSINEDLFVDNKALSNLKSLRTCIVTAGLAWLSPDTFINKPKKNCHIKISCRACISGNRYGDFGLAHFMPINPKFDENDLLFQNVPEFEKEEEEEMSAMRNSKRQAFDKIGKITQKKTLSKLFQILTNPAIQNPEVSITSAEIQNPETSITSATIIKR